MLIDGKILTILVFLIINFLIIFTVKTRTTIVTSLIISHLVAVLFFSLSISNYNSFKEIVLALIVYSMVILFLISNYNPIYLASEENLKIKNNRKILLFFGAGAIFLVIFLSLFLVIKKVSAVSISLNEKKLAKKEKILERPMLLPSHPVHIAVKKFYLGKKFDDQWIDENATLSEVSQRKKSQLKENLSDNFLLKRSSDVIVLIVAVTTSIMLLGSRKKTTNNESV